MANQTPKLIHIGIKRTSHASREYVFLRKLSADQFQWFIEANGNETPTELVATNSEEAMRQANRLWKDEDLQFLMCGFRYNLPERDEHGTNALFHQMAASYNSMNGAYFDEDIGHNCFVQNASLEALSLWRKLAKENRL